MSNLFAELPANTDEEVFHDLLNLSGVRIEKIVSTGQASPPGFWYDQAWDEWIILLTGSATLAVEGEGEIALKPGDYVFLAAHTRHRVVRTDTGQPTVWLAVQHQRASRRQLAPVRVRCGRPA